MTDSNFTIGFIGLGLIGGSIAKGIRRVFPNYTLIGMDETGYDQKCTGGWNH